MKEDLTIRLRDMPSTLRLKAAEFLRIAAEAHTPGIVPELKALAHRYLLVASELEEGASRSSVPFQPTWGEEGWREAMDAGSRSGVSP
ncbi:MAG TPA: hypothetical protein VET85_13015 [Stellaceae bacterium]|nr:hypothetical protein [Stellaceae bacterium]